MAALSFLFSTYWPDLIVVIFIPNLLFQNAKSPKKRKKIQQDQALNYPRRQRDQTDIIKTGEKSTVVIQKTRCNSKKACVEWKTIKSKSTTSDDKTYIKSKFAPEQISDSCCPSSDQWQFKASQGRPVSCPKSRRSGPSPETSSITSLLQVLVSFLRLRIPIEATTERSTHQ